MFNIDEKQTAKRVNQFFKKDLERYQSIAGNGNYNLSSLNLENTKVSSSIKRGQTDNHFISILNAPIIIKCVKPSIENCMSDNMHPYKKILSMILNNYPIFQIKEAVNYQSSRFYDLRNKAFNNFADTFLLEQMKQKALDTLDLHVYIDHHDKAI